MSLFQRGNTYWIKVRVPKDLLEIYGGEFIRESLSSTKQRDARAKHDIRCGEIKFEFNQHRDAARGIKHYDREDLRSWARMAASRPQTEFLRTVNPLGLATGAGQTTTSLREELSSVPRLAVKNAEDFITRQGLALPEDSEGYAYFIGCIRNYLTDSITLDLRVLLGAEQPQLLAVRPPDAPSPFAVAATIENEDDTSNLGSGGKITLIEAVERFKGTDGFTKRAAKTRTSYAESFQLLYRFLTETRYVHTIRPADMEAFREILNALPTNCTKTGDLQEAIAKGKEPIAAATKNRHITAIRQVFGYLRSKWYIRFDPALSLGRFSPKQKWVKAPFSDTDLQAMFLGNGLHGGDLESVYYWLPLLGLYTGARRNELCQLEPGDVVQHQDVWCVNINTQTEDESTMKSVKTPGAVRIVPVHPHLIRLGFIKFVERNRRNPNGRLFKELTYTPINKWGGKFDKTFHRRLGEVITRKSGNTVKGFHSFRHLVNDRLKDATVKYGIIDALLGWSSNERNSEMREHYGDKETPFLNLVDAVNRLEYSWFT